MFFTIRGLVSFRLDENLEVEEILRTPIIKFIDWGRAIDMSALPKNTSFVGRAGTASFDCPEMMVRILFDAHAILLEWKTMELSY